jgi:CubicO group peptidase (beta-lactamase class C family)
MWRRLALCWAAFAFLALHACGGGASEPQKQRQAEGGFDPQMRAALEQTLEKQFEDSGVPGMAATVIVEGRGEWSAAHGLADIRADRTVTPETPFAQGSITKLMVAALTLRLAERGVLDLDDGLGKLVERPPPGAAGLPLRHLLAQTSGLNGIPEANYEVMFRHPRKRATVSQMLRGVRAVRPPGEFRYDDANYLLVGEAIKRATGTNVASVLHRELLDPIGLRDIKLQPDERADPQAAHGYASPNADGDVSDGSRYVPFTSVGRTAWTAGGTVASARSMARFGHALFSGRVLAPDSLREMIRFGEADYFEGYGLGVARTDVHGHEAWAHGGRIPGFASDLFYLPKERMTVAVATNDEGWPLEDTAAELIYAAIEREPQ